MADKPAGWVDFAEVRKIPMVDVLEYVGWLEKLERSGDELKGACPLCGRGEEKQSFSVNVVKLPNVFFCHACKRKGNVLDFAVFYLQKEKPEADLKAGAAWLANLVGEIEQRRNATEDETEIKEPEGLRVHVDALVNAVVLSLERRLERRETLVRDLTDIVLGVLEVIERRRGDE